FSPAITALAFDAFSNTTSPVTLSAFDASDTIIGSADVMPADAVNGSFIGIVSPIAIARVEITGTLDSGELLDELRFGNVGGVGDPVIGVAPKSLAASQGIDTTTDQTLTIHNAGSGDLDWTIDEALSVAPFASGLRGGLAVYATLPDFQAAVADPGALVFENFDGGLTAANMAGIC